MAYSMDLRERVARAHAESGSSAEVAETHDCSASWVRRITQQLRETGSIEPRSTARGDDQRTYDDADEARIRAFIKERPDATLAEVAAHAAERDRPNVVAKRAAWFDRFAGVRARDLVFVDEFGANTKMQRTHGRAAPGERVVARVPHGHYKAIGTIAAMSVVGIVAAASFDDGGTTAARFVDFVRGELVPALRAGQVVVLDNLAAHNDRRVEALVEAAGCKVLRLPPYSPDYNPIEHAISKAKATLRTLAKRTVPALLDAIGAALDAVTASDAKAYIAHCGYATQ